MSIQRYDDHGYGPCNPDPEGSWVRYADHLTAIEREWEFGRAAGYDAGLRTMRDAVLAVLRDAPRIDMHMTLIDAKDAITAIESLDPAHPAQQP